MKKGIFAFMIVLFGTSVLYAKPIPFHVFYKMMEDDVKTYNFNHFFDLTDEMMIKNPNNYSKKQINEVRALKVEMLAEKYLIDNSMAVSQDILDDKTLGKSGEIRVRITRALIFEILDDFKASYNELTLAKKLINGEVNLKKKYEARRLVRLSSWYRVQGFKEKSLAIAEQAKKYADLVKDHRESAIASMLIGFYYYKKTPQKSIKYLKENLQYNKEYNNITGIANAFANLARINLKLRQQNIYEKYLDSAYQVIKNTEFDDTKSEIFFDKSEMFKNKKVLDSALYYHEKYTESKDKYDLQKRVFSIKQQNVLQEYRESQRIKTLLQKENRRQNIYIISLLSVLTLLALVSAVLYENRKQLKAQQKKLVQNNAELDKTAKEKEFYVRELNHRVKNNLSVILSLIDIQKNEKEDHETLFIKLHDRVNTIALGHQLFSYNTSSITASNINLKDYCQNIFQTKIYASNRKTDFLLNVEPIELNIDYALPLGLILNELITNSIKHAETNGEDLSLKLSVKKNLDTIEIVYSDNGNHFKNTKNHDSLGLFIIDGMVNQISATYTRQNSTYTIILPDAKK